jgi:hypothetical protein
MSPPFNSGSFWRLFQTGDPSSAFVKLLWEKGTDFEKQVIKGLEIPFLDLSSYAGIEKN